MQGTPQTMQGIPQTMQGTPQTMQGTPQTMQGTPQMMQSTPRQARQRKFVRRFDLDHDGNVGPGELPPGLADELRPLDRDGDGWLQGDELP